MRIEKNPAQGPKERSRHVGVLDWGLVFNQLCQQVPSQQRLGPVRETRILTHVWVHQVGRRRLHKGRYKEMR
jgi:hypothetical protein